MKNLKFVIIALLVFACKEQEKPLAAGEFRINGTISGLQNGEIYLSKYPDVDTIKVTNGNFIIETKIKGPVEQIYLMKDPKMQGMDPKTGISLYVEPSEMSLELDYNDFSNSKLKGSKTQDDYYRLLEISKGITANYKTEQDAFDASREKYQKASESGASKDQLDSISYEENDIKDKLEPMWAEQQKAMIQFIEDNPKSYVSMSNLVYLLSDMKYEKAKKLFDSFNPEYTNTEEGKLLFEEVEDLKKGIPGATAGDFNTMDINGKPIKLADFKGKYVLIDFWASWCVPCRKGSPHLLTLYDKYHSKGLEVLGVSDDDSNPDAWRKAVEKDKTGVWHHVLRGMKVDRSGGGFKLLEDGVSGGYGIHTLPTKILVGPDGVIVGRYGGGGDDDEAMDKKLAELFDK